MIKIFDAYTVLCWIQNEEGSSYINTLMDKAEKKSIEIVISAINIAEVCYILSKGKDIHMADSFRWRLLLELVPLYSKREL